MIKGRPSTVARRYPRSRTKAACATKTHDSRADHGRTTHERAPAPVGGTQRWRGAGGWRPCGRLMGSERSSAPRSALVVGPQTPRPLPAAAQSGARKSPSKRFAALPRRRRSLRSFRLPAQTACKRSRGPRSLTPAVSPARRVVSLCGVSGDAPCRTKTMRWRVSPNAVRDPCFKMPRVVRLLPCSA